MPDNIKISIASSDVVKINEEQTKTNEPQGKSRFQVGYNYKTDSWTVSGSVPKALYGNNLQEVSNAERENVFKSKKDALAQQGLEVSTKAVENADVWLMEISKTVLLPSSIFLMAVLEPIKHAQVKAVWNVGDKRYFQAGVTENGDKVVFGSKHHQITFYDKTRQMLQCGNKEEKALAKSLLAAGKQALKIEIRLCNACTVKRIIHKYDPHNNCKLTDLYNVDLEKRILNDYWQQIVQAVPTRINTDKEILRQQIALGLQSGLSFNTVCDGLIWNRLNNIFTHKELRNIVVDKSLPPQRLLQRAQMWACFRKKMRKCNLPVVDIDSQWEEAKRLITEQLQTFKPITAEDLE